MSNPSKTVSHTPGPWKQGPFQVYVGKIVDRDITFREIADCTLGEGRQPNMSAFERNANARLIAAAPALLEALQWAVEILDFPALRDHLPGNMIPKLRAAIRQATGEEVSK